MQKVQKASKETGIKEIAIAGGVSANSGLRDSLAQLGDEYAWETYIPRFEYCTDNAAMIAITGKYMLEEGLTTDQRVTAQARVPFQPIIRQ